MTFIFLSSLKSPLAAHLCFHAKTKLWPLSMLHFSYLPCSHLPSTTPVLNKSSKSREQNLMFLLKQCYTVKDLKQVHALVIQTGCDQNLFVVGKIIVFYAVSQHDLMDYAVSVFETVENPDGFLWNTIIRGFGNSGQFERAFGYYKRMQENGEVADNFTFSFLLKACGQLGSVALGKQIHCRTLKQGLESHAFVRNTLIHMYGMLKDIKIAVQLFEEIPKSDLVAWNIIIDCHVHCGQYKNALELFSLMLHSGMEPDEATLVVTISACSALGALYFGRWVHSRINQTRLVHEISVSNSLMDMYAKCGAIEEAQKIFHKMIKRNTVSWSIMILGLATHGHADEALKLFSKMLEERLEKPNDVIFLGVLCACSHKGMVEEGRRYFQSMINDFHIQPTIKHYGCMVDNLGRAGFVEAAYKLIKSMPMECNAIIWRTLLAACRVHGNLELGEQVRRHLLDLEPDHSSDYVLLATMYASAGQWNEAFRVRKSMSNRRVQKPEPGNSLIGIYPSMTIKLDPTEAS